MVQSLINYNSAEVYQLRIWLKGISPMIWRRLLVKSNSSIADLHYTIQIAMGWDDDYRVELHKGVKSFVGLIFKRASR
jgi:hypothetical protein